MNDNSHFRAHPDRRGTPIVCCDFDGTITQVDVTDLILSEFAHPAWQEVEQEWMQGAIGSRECLERQLALVDASPAELHKLIDAVPLDPGFGAFHQFVRQRRLPFYIMSEGLDLVIRRTFRKAGLRPAVRNGAHIFSSQAVLRGRRLLTSFPHTCNGCGHGCATCKTTIIRRLRREGAPVVFIGDGLSDRFAVQEADVVFAKHGLAAYCRDHHIDYEPYETFHSVRQALERHLAEGIPIKSRQSVAVGA